jgi:hypothetical protein
MECTYQPCGASASLRLAQPQPVTGHHHVPTLPRRMITAIMRGAESEVIESSLLRFGMADNDVAVAVVGLLISRGHR